MPQPTRGRRLGGHVRTVTFYWEMTAVLILGYRDRGVDSLGDDVLVKHASAVDEVFNPVALKVFCFSRVEEKAEMIEREKILIAEKVILACFHKLTKISGCGKNYLRKRLYRPECKRAPATLRMRLGQHLLNHFHS